MIREAIQYVAGLAVSADKQRYFTVEAEPEPDHVYFLVGETGVPKRVTAEQALPEFRFDRPCDIAKFAKNCDSHRFFVVSQSSIDLVYFAGERRQKAFCSLNFTEPFAALLGKSKEPYTQDELIWNLRTLFKEHLPASNLLAMVRNIKFRSAEQSGSEVYHGKESMGRSVERELTGAGELPEEILLKGVRVFEEIEFTFDIQCVFDVQVKTQRFRMCPYPGQTKEAIEMSLGAAEDILSLVEGATIYRGSCT